MNPLRLSLLRFTLPLAFLLLNFSSLASASLVNVTVDDAGSDPNGSSQIIYAPSGFWQQGQTCNGCAASPDVGKVMNHTWHEGLLNASNSDSVTPTISFQFQGKFKQLSSTVPHSSFAPEGSALYVYCVVDLGINSSMGFVLDGQVVGNFNYQANLNTTGYNYNVPVYANSSIPDGIHSFVLQNGPMNGPSSIVLFDYYVYS